VGSAQSRSVAPTRVENQPKKKTGEEEGMMDEKKRKDQE